MKYSKHLGLEVAKKLYGSVVPAARDAKVGRNWKMFSQKEYANNLIFDYLQSPKPCMIARFGYTEMSCLVNYLGVKKQERSRLNYIKGQSLRWWWNQNIVQQMHNWSGFFPASVDKIEQFCRLMLNDIPQVDILGSWLYDENYFKAELVNARRVVLEDLEPFFSSKPWTWALAGKKVLVVHPFAETIGQQYKKRKLLFDNDLLPDFSLITIKAVQSLAGTETPYKDWFEALEFMKNQIDSVDYDVAIIGCGAYGFPLAAHVKRMGKKAVHLAGATQLVFGIKGKRWEEFIVWPYMNLFNEHWVRPSDNEKIKNAQTIEGACYW